jgi:hypothetical protein
MGQTTNKQLLAALAILDISPQDWNERGPDRREILIKPALKNAKLKYHPDKLQQRNATTAETLEAASKMAALGIFSEAETYQVNVNAPADPGRKNVRWGEQRVRYLHANLNLLMAGHYAGPRGMLSPYSEANRTAKQGEDHVNALKFNAVDKEGVKPALEVSADNRMFLAAVKAGNLDEANRLQKGSDINVCESPQTRPFYVVNPLLIAISAGNADMVGFLLEAGATLPDYLTKHNITPLRLAVAFDVPAVASLLVDQDSREPALAESIHALIGTFLGNSEDNNFINQPLSAMTIETGAADILEMLLSKSTITPHTERDISTTASRGYSQSVKTVLELALKKGIDAAKNSNPPKANLHFEQACLLLRQTENVTKNCYYFMQQIPKNFRYHPIYDMIAQAHKKDVTSAFRAIYKQLPPNKKATGMFFRTSADVNIDTLSDDEVYQVMQQLETGAATSTGSSIAPLPLLDQEAPLAPSAGGAEQSHPALLDQEDSPASSADNEEHPASAGGAELNQPLALRPADDAQLALSVSANKRSTGHLPALTVRMQKASTLAREFLVGTYLNGALRQDQLMGIIYLERNAAASWQDRLPSSNSNDGGLNAIRQHSSRYYSSEFHTKGTGTAPQFLLGQKGNPGLNPQHLYTKGSRAQKVQAGLAPLTGAWDGGTRVNAPEYSSTLALTDRAASASASTSWSRIQAP